MSKYDFRQVLSRWRLTPVLAVFVGFVVLVNGPNVAAAMIPTRVWIGLQCSTQGTESILTSYYETSHRRHYLRCRGWGHIRNRHGSGGKGSSWEKELAKFSSHPMDWHYLMDWATQVTIAEHSAGEFSRADGTKCFMHDFFRHLPEGDSLKRVVVIVSKNSGGNVVTSFPAAKLTYHCQKGASARAAGSRSEVYMRCGLVRQGCYTHLSGGKSVYFTPDTGSRIVRGKIRDRWKSLGWERSFLGYPTTSEACGLVRGGCFNHFQGGTSIYFSPVAGAWPVRGKIREAWSRDGWERSRFGYPTSGETHPKGAPSHHRTQAFERGFLYWDGKTVTGEWHDPRSRRVEAGNFPAGG